MDTTHPEPTIVGTFEVTIDPSPTFEQMKADGKIPVSVVCFHREMGDDLEKSEVNAGLKGMKLERANTTQTLAFAAQHPEVQRSRVIVSGVFRTSSDGRCGFLDLGSVGCGHGLHLYWPDRGDRWCPFVCFLAVPEEEKLEILGENCLDVNVAPWMSLVDPDPSRIRGT